MPSAPLKGRGVAAAASVGQHVNRGGIAGGAPAVRGSCGPPSSSGRASWHWSRGACGIRKGSSRKGLVVGAEAREDPGGRGEGGKKRKKGREVELQPLKSKFPTKLDWPEFSYDRFQLGAIVGQGSYGDVFEGFDTEKGQEVAVKRMTKFRDSNSMEKTLFKLSREVSLLRTLQNSPFTVRVYDALEDDYSVYIVTEMLRGGDLDELLNERGILTEEEAACCMRPILEFLKACHEERVCFGDVKPSNFMLGERMSDEASLEEIDLKAIDFGCSQRVPQGSALQIRMGTPIYFAPEVFRKWYGCEADCWSAGIMFYLMLAGRFPLFLDEELATLTPQDVMQRVIQDDVRFPDDPWADLSPEANSLARQLLEKNKNERITAEEALEHPWFGLFDAEEDDEDEEQRLLGNIVSKGDHLAHHHDQQQQKQKQGLSHHRVKADQGAERPMEMEEVVLQPPPRIDRARQAGE